MMLQTAPPLKPPAPRPAPSPRAMSSAIPIPRPAFPPSLRIPARSCPPMTKNRVMKPVQFQAQARPPARRQSRQRPILSPLPRRSLHPQPIRQAHPSLRVLPTCACRCRAQTQPLRPPAPASPTEVDASEGLRRCSPTNRMAPRARVRPAADTSPLMGSKSIPRWGISAPRK